LRTTMCLPCCAAARACSAWNWLGVEIQAASTSGSAHISSTLW
jgi:hypothetical protein